MDNKRTPALLWGTLMILLGAAFLMVEVFGAPTWFDPDRSWPLIVIGVGGLLAIIGLLTRQSGMAVPACVVGGIGMLLYYQNRTGDWDSWAYAWSLIPGFVGVGIILAGLFGGHLRRALVGGLWLLIISAVMFVAFGSFLGPLSGLGLSRFWPLVVIALGLLMLVESLATRRQPAASDHGSSYIASIKTDAAPQ